MSRLTMAPADLSTRRVAIPWLSDDLMPPDARASIRSLCGITMGTTWSVMAACPPEADVDAMRDTIDGCLDQVVAQMSTWIEDSNISRFNRSAGEWCNLPDDFATVLACALDVARASGGAYDPTVGPLVNLWGFGPDGVRHHPPPDADIAGMRARCGWRHVELDATGQRVRQPGGVYLDLSAVAKGFAVDAVSAALTRIGVKSHLVEIGGELRGRGIKPNAHPWWVEVESPVNDRAVHPSEQGLVIALHECAVATSGDYRKGFGHDGRWYSHTIDPHSGRPVSHAPTAVTVIHPSCMLADAWSTALMVLGPEEGTAVAQDRGLAALFVERAGSRLFSSVSPAFEALLR